MKKPIILLLAITVFFSFVMLCGFAQKNYLDAMFYARNSDLTDAGIEEAMSAHGFNIDANNMRQPSMFEKIQALLTKQTN